MKSRMPMLAATAGLAFSSFPAQAQTPPPQPLYPGEAQEALLEHNVPADVTDYIDQNVVVIKALRCSGTIIGMVGVETAAHCLRNNPGEKSLNTVYKGADDKEYVVGSFTPATGTDSVDLQPTPPIQEFVMPPNKDLGKDQMLGVFPGSTPQQVIAAWRAQQLSPSEVRHLNFKKPIYTAGYPYTQDGDDAGNRIRQVSITRPFDFEKINSVVESVSATMKTNSNGALVDWGWSGGPAIVERSLQNSDGTTSTVAQPIGNFSFFSLFKARQERGGSRKHFSQEDADYFRQYYHSAYRKVKWKGVDGVCSFPFKTINSKHFQVVYVVPDKDAIPAPAKPLKN